LKLVRGVYKPLTDDWCFKGEGVRKAWEDWTCRREGLQEYLGILDGEVSSLMRSREGVCLGAEGVRALGVRDSSANALLREMLRNVWPDEGSFCKDEDEVLVESEMLRELCSDPELPLASETLRI